MTLTETIPLMTSEDYRDRFKAEYWQLKNRTEKLQAMLTADEVGTLPFKFKCSRTLLRDQLRKSRDLAGILATRARVEGINLEE